MNGVFDVGQRVIVCDDNEFDEKRHPEFGPMAGHYGKVVVVSDSDEDEPALIGVEISGRVGGPVALPRELYGQRPRTWYFYPPELEHAD